jgi:hypothetical protein
MMECTPGSGRYHSVYSVGKHRDRYQEKQQTEKIDTEVRDIDRIRIRLDERLRCTRSTVAVIVDLWEGRSCKEMDAVERG